MRGFSPLLGAALAMAVAGAMASPRVDGEPRSKRGYDRKPPKPRPKPAPRVLTEADNTRLRLAAEKRRRKAQRQAKDLTNG
jgi:hypothetical protein